MTPYLICHSCHESTIITDTSLLSRKGFQVAMTDLLECRTRIIASREYFKAGLWKVTNALRTLRSTQ